MEVSCRTRSRVVRTHVRTHVRSFARPLILGLLGMLLFCAGGCAILPFALTTASSFALPQTASLAMTGVKGAFNSAQLAADERDMNTIMRDNMLTLKAKSTLLTERSAADVQVYAYNGDIFAVGVVDNEDQREHIIRTLKEVRGVDEVKGVLRLRDLENPNAGQNDNYLENITRLALARYLLHKNAGVEVRAVQGELCLVGVVGSHAEALDLIQYVESVSGTGAMSLLAIRDEYATGKSQNNRRYLLAPSQHPETASPQLAEAEPLRLPEPPARALKQARSEDLPAQPAVWNKARLRLGERLQLLAKREQSPTAKAELLTLAGQVTTDQDLSIADRLSVAADQAKNQHARLKIQSLLALY